MSASTDLPDSAAAQPAAAELDRLHEQCAAARAALGQVRAELALAQAQLEAHPAILLREANEQLVMATLRAQQRVETRERELGDAVRTLGLDPLTQLPNRLLLRDRFAQAAAAARRRGGRLAVLFVDLDHFKWINDTHGHAAGDKALRSVAQALVAAVRESDTVSRHGGDEFVILLGELCDTGDAAAIAQKIQAALLHLPGPVAGSHLSASIGCAIYPEDGEDIDTLIANADAAMYRGKRAPATELWQDAAAPDAAGQVAAAPDAAPARAVAQDAAARPEGSPTQLRDVNERLVMAVLNARDSQQAAETAFSVQQTNLAVTAHELRNPLAPISYAVTMLKSVQAREPVVSRVRDILERQLAHLTRLVGDLLDISRASTGKLHIERAVVDVGAMVEDAVQSVVPAMQQRAQKMDLRLPPQVLHVQGDAMRLVQVLSNLLDNASKYTPDGGAIRLAVTSDAQQVFIAVSDNGIGIAEEVLPHVFDSLVQEGRAAEFNGEGMGIGLMLVRELVQAHGGSVAARSRGRGCGSEFVVTLPRVLAEAD